MPWLFFSDCDFKPNARPCLPDASRNIISSHMSHSYVHIHRAVSDDPGWSLLRLSVWQRLGIALVVIAVVWATTLAVIL